MLVIRLLRSGARAGRRIVNLAALSVITLSVAVLGVFVFLAEWGEEYTSGRIPTQFYARLEQDQLLDDYQQVFGVAHNSGGTLAATKEALAHGADVIEIDVVSMNGTLYAAHASPLRWLGPRVFRGPTLAAVWEAAAEADVIKLDLKESSAGYLDLLFAFLAERRDHEVIVATGNERVLAAFETRAPWVIRLLSVGSQRRLRQLQRRPDLAARIDGVTIRERLVTEETGRWLESAGLLVLAWTVNDLERVNELVHLGVDAITTDNLAIMELLGGHQRREAWLRDRVRR